MKEEWNDPLEGHDLEEDFNQEEEREKVIDNSSTLSDKYGVLIFLAFVFFVFLAVRIFCNRHSY